MREIFFNILAPIIQIPSPSGNEENLAKYIMEKYTTKEWVCEKDDFHNIYFWRSTDSNAEKLPLLIAHLDTHPNGDSEENNRILAQEGFLSLENEQINKSHRIQAGFDDKAGVAAILYLMKHTDLKFRALFVTQEEITDLGGSYGRKGGGGIDFAIKENFRGIFKNAAYVLVLDRMNGGDIIDEYGNDDLTIDRPRIRLCSKKFRETIEKISDTVNYSMRRAESFNIADAYNIRRTFQNMNCVNLSIGYYDCHKPMESIKIDESLGVLKVVQACLKSSALVDL